MSAGQLLCLLVLGYLKLRLSHIMPISNYACLILRLSQNAPVSHYAYLKLRLSQITPVSNYIPADVLLNLLFRYYTFLSQVILLIAQILSQYNHA